VVGSIAMMMLMTRRVTGQNHPSDFAETPAEDFFSVFELSGPYFVSDSRAPQRCVL